MADPISIKDSVSSIKGSQMGHFVMALFGVHIYQPTLDFAFFIIFRKEQMFSAFDVISRKSASKRLREAIKL